MREANSQRALVTRIRKIQYTFFGDVMIRGNLECPDSGKTARERRQREDCKGRETEKESWMAGMEETERAGHRGKAGRE